MMFSADRIVRSINEGVGGGLMNYLVEPFTTVLGHRFSNAHVVFRKFREAMDPDSVSAPGKVVFTEEEFKNFPDTLLAPIRMMMKEAGIE